MADQITISRAVVQQALEALEIETAWAGPTPKGAAAIAALRAALAQQAESVRKPATGAAPCAPSTWFEMNAQAEPGQRNEGERDR